MAFTLRNTKGSALTYTELDANFTAPSYGNFGTATGAATGEVRASGNVVAYATSDRSLKENIKDIDKALLAVEHIGGKTFDWTAEYLAEHSGEDGYYVRKEDFGVIAQDVQEVFPLAVRTRDNGTLAVDYEKLIALAFAAIKELSSEVKSLKGVN